MEIKRQNAEIKSTTGRGNKPDKAHPWLWIEKAGRRMIRDVRKKFDGAFSVPAALLVYDAFCEIASDEATCTFEASLDHISDVAGLSVATVKRLLPVFEELKLLAIERSYRANTYLKAPSRYTILAIAHSEPSNAQSRNKVSVSLSRRNDEKSKKNVVEKPAHARREAARLNEIAAAAASDQEFVEKLKSEFPKNNVPREYSRYHEHCNKHRLTPTREGFISWMLRARPECRPLQTEANQKHPRAFSRNTGTANEGKSGQYAGIGKVISEEEHARILKNGRAAFAELKESLRHPAAKPNLSSGDFNVRSQRKENQTHDC